MAPLARPVVRWWAAVLCLTAPCTSDRFDSWETLRNYSVRPVCVPIPSNMTLCQNIGYSRLRLPNLLEHDSVSEVLQQAAGWMPLLNLQCDADARLFLCSLYAPICLEHPIYPCRSLCEQVKRNCAGLMLKWGFPWPKQLACDQFPLENDMCIKPQAHRALSAGANATVDETNAVETETDAACRACQQPSTKENIMQHYCQADVVLVARIRRIKSGKIKCGKARILKPQSATRAQRQALRRPTLQWRRAPHCCPDLGGTRARHLIMATAGKRSRLTPTLILPWKKNAVFRSLRRHLKAHDCGAASPSLQEQVAPPITSTERRPWRRRGDHRRRGSGGGRRGRQQRRRPGTTTPAPN